MIGLVALAILSASDSVEPGSIISAPLVGVRVDADGPAFLLDLPWSNRLVSDRASPLRPTHLVPELTVGLGKRVTFELRASLRWLVPLRPWLSLGPTLGMGATVSDAGRPMLTLGVLARLGSGPFAFGLIAGRVDVRVDGTLAWSALVGGTYW
ncbi:MAG: hypothetical protein ACOZQL_12855 [Myxococcota bacterium]